MIIDQGSNILGVTRRRMKNLFCLGQPWLYFVPYDRVAGHIYSTWFSISIEKTRGVKKKKKAGQNIKSKKV